MMMFPVTFKSAASTQDSYGQLETTLNNVVTTGATVKEMKREEDELETLEVSRQVIEVIARYTPSLAGVTTRDVLAFKGNDYEILTVDQFDFSNKQIKFTARRLV